MQETTAERLKEIYTVLTTRRVFFTGLRGKQSDRETIIYRSSYTIVIITIGCL